MWKLFSSKNTTETYSLIVDKTFSVGRKDTDILIQGDQSVSRHHASLTVLHPHTQLSSPHTPARLQLKDSSTFGCKVNGKLVKKSECDVKSGDSILFGTTDSLFKVLQEKLIVSHSCLNDQGKEDVKKSVLKLGGHVINDWRKESTILVMSNLSATVKVITALISQKPVVKPEYFKHLLEAREGNTKDPSTEDYLPPLIDSKFDPEKVSFAPDERRRKLFSGKTFVFLAQKAYKSLNGAITMAGGKAILMEEGSDKSVLIEENTYVMACDPQNPSQKLSHNSQGWVTHVMEFLQENNKRAIELSEIGYAVLYVSIESYCNPLVMMSQSMQFPDGSLSQVNNSTVGGSTTGKSSSNLKSSKSESFKLPSIKQEPISQENSRQKPASIENTSNTVKEVPRTSKTSEESEVTIVDDETPLKQETPSPAIESNKASTRKRQRTPPSDTLDEEVSFAGLPRSKRPRPPKQEQKSTTDLDDEFDFNNIPSIRRRPAMKKEKVDANANQVDDSFADLPSCRRKKRSASEVVIDDEETEKRGRDIPKVTKTDTDFDDIPVVRKRKVNAEESGKADDRNKRKHTDIDDLDDEDGFDGLSNLKTKRARVNKNKTPPPSPKPFTALKNSPKHVVPSAIEDSGDFIGKKDISCKPVKQCTEFIEDGLVSNVVVEESSLICKRAKPTRSEEPVRTWKGRVVKNFKKFRRNGRDAVDSLPRIIGGRDLVAHSSNKAQLEAWLHDEKDEEKNDNFLENCFDNPAIKKPRRATSKR